ncbi:MAG: hypothetical protein PUK21_03085 [Peptostreptococcaceae bacterium]|nr:hypothetical protein [Peptostreptococcaceae bacterium]MDY5739545.1 hypothetical protein [Anaerovoracaceae bacterium]
MNKVLVIGNAKSIWIKEYIFNIHHYLGNDVYLTSYGSLGKEDKSFYSSIGVNIISFVGNSKWTRMFSIIFQLLNFSIANRGRINIVDIQSPPRSMQSKLIAIIIVILGGKVITTFWGSDIFYANKKDATRMKWILDRSRWINASTQSMREKIQLLYGDVYKDKCACAEFGSPAFEAIKACTLSKNECKKSFGLNENKVAIAVGYNGRKEQQHIKVLEQLSKLEDNQKDKIELIIHIGYSISTEYRQELVEALKISGIEHIIIDEMLNLESIAQLRISTDVFIHAQVSDALSGSIRESIYSGAILINPNWLKYDKFDDDRVDYIKYSEFSEIPTIIENVLNGKVIVDKERNKEILYKEYSWDAVRAKWVRMFDE